MSLKGEIKSFSHAVKGAITSLEEKHVRLHLLIFAGVAVVNFLLDVSRVEWGIMLLAATILLVTEVVNTAIEEIMDFVHPDHSPVVGKIKDLAAGAVFFAGGGGLIVALIIYTPKVLELL